MVIYKYRVLYNKEQIDEKNPDRDRDNHPGRRRVVGPQGQAIIGQPERSGAEQRRSAEGRDREGPRHAPGTGPDWRGQEQPAAGSPERQRQHRHGHRAGLPERVEGDEREARHVARPHEQDRRQGRLASRQGRWPRQAAGGSRILQPEMQTGHGGGEVDGATIRLEVCGGAAQGPGQEARTGGGPARGSRGCCGGQTGRAGGGRTSPPRRRLADPLGAGRDRRQHLLRASGGGAGSADPVPARGGSEEGQVELRQSLPLNDILVFCLCEAGRVLPSTPARF